MATNDLIHDLTDAIRLLSATGSLPPTGRGFAAVRQETAGVITADLQGLGPLGDGDLKLTAKSSGLATAVLWARPDQGAAILTHAPYASAWGLARRPLPVRYSPLIRFTSDDHIPVLHSAEEQVVVAAFSASLALRAVLIPGHGILVLGKDLAGAARSLVSLEEAARLAWQAESIGGQQSFPSDAGNRIAKGIVGDAA